MCLSQNHLGAKLLFKGGSRTNEPQMEEAECVSVRLLMGEERPLGFMAEQRLWLMLTE